jgi:hypothetical protein
MSVVKKLCDPVIDNLSKAMRFWSSGNQREAIKYIGLCEKRLGYIKSTIKKFKKP